MSTATLICKPLQIACRTRRVRDRWTSEERTRRTELSAQRLSDLVARIIGRHHGDDLWAVGSLTPADLRRFSA